MAHPLLPHDALRQRFDLYLSPSELDALRARARSARTSVSAFVRCAALNHKIEAPPPTINLKAWSQMARVCGNLNQLAHAVAAGRATTIDPDVITQVGEQVRLLRLELIGAKTSEAG